MRARALVPLLVIASLMAGGASASAQESALDAIQPSAPGGPVDPPPVTLPPRVGVRPDMATPLTLEQAIRLALEHNTDVSIARLTRDAAEQDARAALGAYDPRLLPLFTWQKTVSPSTSALSGGANGSVEERRLGGDLRLEGLSPWAGGRFNVDFSAARVVSSNSFLRLNPVFPAALGATYTQPLLRGRIIDDERRQILLTRRAVDLTDAQLQRVVMDQLSLVEQAYWDFVYATSNLDVLVKALEQARAQVASNERQVRQGTLAPIDVVEAQTQVATIEQTVAAGQQTVTEAENRLKRLILRNREERLWGEALDPAHPVDRPVPTLSLDEALKMAMAQRPELREIDITLAQNAVDARYFRDLARPQADVIGSYTLQGLAGTALDSAGNPLRSSTDPAVLQRLNELSALAGFDDVQLTPGTSTPVPDFLRGGLGDSLSNIWTRRFPVALVQVQMELPLRNRTAAANVARTEISRRQLEMQRVQTEQAIEAEVRNALQAVRSTQERLIAAGSERRNAQEQYESEQRRFESGLSTVFLVLQRQTTLVTAQAKEVRARADLNQAIAIFDRAVGATLTQHGIAMSAD